MRKSELETLEPSTEPLSCMYQEAFISQYYKQLEHRTIVINDGITRNILELAVFPLLDMMNDGSGEPITIVLQTEGGELYAGMHLVDVIESATCPIIIRLCGMVASAGIYIACAGKNNPNVETFCYPFTVGLLHAGSLCQLDGTINDVGDLVRFQDKYEKRIRDFILSHTLITSEKYDAMYRCQWYMDSDELLEYGIVDGIITPKGVQTASHTTRCRSINNEILF